MRDDIYPIFLKAKNENNLNELERLYNETKDTTIGLEYAKLLIRQKSYENGRKILEGLLETNNKYFALLELGKLEKKLGNIKNAREYFKQALNSKGRVKFFAKSELGQLEHNVGNLHDSYMYFESLIGSEIEDSILYDLSNVCKKLGYYDKALIYLKKYLETKPNDNIAKFELGKLEKHLGNVVDAKECFISLLCTSSRNFALLELGKLEIELGNYENAKKYLEKLCNYGIKDKRFAFMELGRLEKLLGNYDKTREFFEFLLNFEGKDKLIATLELGKLEKSIGNREKAKEYFNSLLSTGSEMFARLELAKLLIEENNLDESYENLIIVYNSKSKERVLSLKELGRIELLKGDKDKAKEYFLEFYQLNKNLSDRLYVIVELGKLE